MEEKESQVRMKTVTPKVIVPKTVMFQEMGYMVAVQLAEGAHHTVALIFDHKSELFVVRGQEVFDAMHGRVDGEYPPADEKWHGVAQEMVQTAKKMTGEFMI